MSANEDRIAETPREEKGPEELEEEVDVAGDGGDPTAGGVEEADGGGPVAVGRVPYSDKEVLQKRQN